jgi:predicted lipid-binding transport protein (Tim44 family)
MNRTFTQPGSPGWRSRPRRGAGGFFNRPGMGMLGGLAAGFLGAGLLGMLFGGGCSPASAACPRSSAWLLQVALIVIVVRLAMSWWQRRHTPASAYAGAPAEGPGAQPSFRSGLSGFGLGSNQPALEIQPADYEAFERLLGEIQAAWSNEDIAKLHTLATPEMVSYFSKGSRGEQGQQRRQQGEQRQAAAGATSPKPGGKAKPISPAWRCGSRWSTRPGAHHRPSGLGQRNADRSHRSVDLRPPRGADWELSAIQQTS